MLKRCMEKEWKKMHLQLVYWGISSCINVNPFLYLSIAALSNTMSKPFFSLGSLMTDTIDSQLLSEIRIVSFWFFRFI